MHLLTLCTIILTTAAHPNIFGRAACNRDDCLRQVVASSHSPGPAKGSADCSSFFKKTLTPCPVTTTVSTTTTPVVTSTATTVVSTTTTTTTVVSATTTSTVTASATVTTSTTVTNTVTVTSAPQQKRDGNAPRAAAACTTVGSPSKIPPYASSCTNVAKYSSACSCDGVTMTTTTLAPVTSTNTATITAPPSTSVVATSTSTSTITATETDTVSVTATTTTTTTSTVTQTMTVTATTTVAPTFRGSSCNSPGGGRGAGGCSDNCYCDQRAQNSRLGVCDPATACGIVCQSDVDCPDDQACSSEAIFVLGCGSPVCVPTTGCTSSFQKRNPSDAAIDVLAFRDVSPNPGAIPIRAAPPSV